MKREIICPSCTEESKQLHGSGPETKYPGEFVNFKHGKARGRMVCDSCGTIIPLDSSCTAFTIYTNRDLEKVRGEEEFLLRWPVEFIDVALPQPEE